ncbi:MAG: antitoxin AF2212-like protein [Gammaproteobacteria bacterium]
MKQTIDAIYDNGTFKPVDPAKVHLLKGQRVTLVVDDQLPPEPLRLAARVYDGLSGQEIEPAVVSRAAQYFAVFPQCTFSLNHALRDSSRTEGQEC